MSKKLKVLFFSSGLAPEYGGAAISEASLCKALQENSDVQLVCREDRWNRKFVRDFFLETPQEYSPQDFYACWKNPKHALRNWFQGVDVVHMNGHWRWEYFFIGRICSDLGIPYVLHPRGMMLVGGRKYRVKKAFNFLLGNSLVKKADKLIVLSDFETRHLQKYPVSPDKITVIPNGVCGLFPENDFISHQEVSDHFLYFGRLEHRKNLLFLLDAYARYLKLGGSKKLRLKGPIEHGYEQLIQKRVHELNITHHVSVLAPSYGAEKWRQLAQAIAVVYPCLDEPFGRVPFETLLAGGLPIVPQESGGAEYLKLRMADAIYPTHSVEGLCDRLFWAERLSPDSRIKVISQAKQWVSEELEWNKISKRVQDTYWEAVSQADSNISSSAASSSLLNE